MKDPKDVALDLGLDHTDPEVLEQIRQEQQSLDEQGPPTAQKRLGKTNRLAVAAFICAWVVPFGVPGLALGKTAQREIRESGGTEAGTGYAEWAFVLGIVNLCVCLLAIVAFTTQG